MSLIASVRSVMTEAEKTKTLYWLQRILREKETAVIGTPISHVDMAQRKVGYAARGEAEKAAAEAAEKAASKFGPEIEALRHAIALVEATVPIDARIG